jgi:hypothetical protein
LAAEQVAQLGAVARAARQQRLLERVEAVELAPLHLLEQRGRDVGVRFDDLLLGLQLGYLADKAAELVAAAASPPSTEPPPLPRAARRACAIFALYIVHLPP